MINDSINVKVPEAVIEILNETNRIGFSMQCEEKVGAILRLLASSKPKGKMLELGTGTGVSTAWLLSGMDKESELTTIEINPEWQTIAKKILDNDKRIEFVEADANIFIDNLVYKYDLIFADTFAGKFENREKILASVMPGGFYIIDDLIPQKNCPTGDHPLKVRDLVSELELDNRFEILKMNWASGLMICVRKNS